MAERGNCILAPGGYPGRVVVCDEIHHGMRITPVGEEATRNHRAFYTKVRNTSSFDLQLRARNEAEWSDLGAWLKRYIERISDPANTTVSPMRVICAARRFDKVGVPTATVGFGDDYDAITYPIILTFEGVSNAVSRPEHLSSYVIGRGVRNFHPAYWRLGGEDEAALYGDIPSSEDVIRRGGSGIGGGWAI